MLGLLVLWAASGLYVPYQYEPLGPKAMPYLVGTLLSLCGLLLLLSPAAALGQGSKRVVTGKWRQPLLLALGLLGYAFCYEWLGFAISSLVFSSGFAHLCGASKRASLLVAAGLTIAGHLLLVTGLDLQLPPGLLKGWL